MARRRNATGIKIWDSITWRNKAEGSLQRRLRLSELSLANEPGHHAEIWTTPWEKDPTETAVHLFFMDDATYTDEEKKRHGLNSQFLTFSNYHKSRRMLICSPNYYYGDTFKPIPVPNYPGHGPKDWLWRVTTRTNGIHTFVLPKYGDSMVHAITKASDAPDAPRRLFDPDAL